MKNTKPIGSETLQDIVIAASCKATHLYPESVELFQAYCDTLNESVIMFLESTIVGPITGVGFEIVTRNDKFGTTTRWTLNAHGIAQFLSKSQF